MHPSLWVTVSSVTATALLGFGFSAPYISRLRQRKHLLQHMKELEKSLLRSNATTSSFDTLDRQYKECQKLWNQFQYVTQMDAQQNRVSRVSFALSHLKHLVLKTVAELFDHSESWYNQQFRHHKQIVLQTILSKYFKNPQIQDSLTQNVPLQEKLLQFFKDALFKSSPTPLLTSLLEQFKTILSSSISWRISIWIQLLQSPSIAAKQLLEHFIQEAKRINSKPKLLESIAMVEYMYNSSSKVEWIVLLEQTIDWLYYDWMTYSITTETIPLCISLLEKQRSVPNDLHVKMDSLEKLVAKSSKYNTSLMYVEFAKSLQVENIGTRIDVFVVHPVNQQWIYIPIPIYLERRDEVSDEQWDRLFAMVNETLEKKQVQPHQNIICCVEETIQDKYSSTLTQHLQQLYPTHSVHISQSFTVFLNSE